MIPLSIILCFLLICSACFVCFWWILWDIALAEMAVFLSTVSYTCFLSLPFTFLFQCLPHTDFLWNNWFASPISWLAVFKVSYSVTLRPSTIPSWVSNGSPETSNGSLDELRFPHSFILHLLMDPEVTFFSQNENLPQSFLHFWFGLVKEG